jgi:hypothetical protein|tara:strand:- start:108 stop:920 length:813 start_codon:yes stop_codon:yes gene_type:complete
MSTVYILGRGPSLKALEGAIIRPGADVILMNDHSHTLQNPRMAQKLGGAHLYVMCNVNQAGFTPAVFDKANITACLTNRFKPDWPLWREHKSAQRKHHEGGTLNNLGRLPYLAEDEPYINTWRGPEDRNREIMKTYDGRPIEHMPEEAEQYLFEVYENKLVCNCSYYGTLYAIMKLKATNIVYYGLDFYQNINIEKKWYMNPPSYLSPEWRLLRMRYEGEHMSVLWDDYLARYFPTVTFNFHTIADLEFKSNNIKYHKIATIDTTASPYY